MVYTDKKNNHTVVIIHYDALLIFFLVRFSKKNMILTGLWCSRDKPVMNMYLKPLIESVNELYSKGLFLFHIVHN